MLSCATIKGFAGTCIALLALEKEQNGCSSIRAPTVAASSDADNGSASGPTTGVIVAIVAVVLLGLAVGVVVGMCYRDRWGSG